MSVIKPTLLFTLGSIEVYHYGEFKDETPTNVYWQCLKALKGYGPFPSVTMALSHITMYGDHIRYDHNYLQLATMSSAELPSNVIQVVFKAKRRSKPL